MYLLIFSDCHFNEVEDLKRTVDDIFSREELSGHICSRIAFTAGVYVARRDWSLPEQLADSFPPPISNNMICEFYHNYIS
jgi:hypothetical protein